MKKVKEQSEALGGWLHGPGNILASCSRPQNNLW